MAAGVGLAARTELLARAGTGFVRLLLHPPVLQATASLPLTPPLRFPRPDGAAHRASRDSPARLAASLVQAARPRIPAPQDRARRDGP